MKLLADPGEIGAVGFAYTCMAACKYAIQEKRKDIAILGAMGAALSGTMALLLFVPIEGLNISLSQESYILLILWTTIGVAFHVWVGLSKSRDGYENLEEAIKASLENIDLAPELSKKEDFTPIRDFDMDWEWGSEQDMKDYGGEDDEK